MDANGTGSLTDSQLLERIRAGDEAAFESLLLRHEPAMRARARRLVARRLGGRVSVSDILQEARIAAHERLPSFRPTGQGTVRGWLLKIVENRAISAARFHGRMKRDAQGVAGPGALAHLEAQQPSPSQAAHATEMSETAHRALAALPEDYRVILELTHVRGMTIREAAECLGRSREVCKKLYGRAMARFGELVQRSRGDGHGP